MLILGISTSTEQVGCALGGHEGVLGSVHTCRGRRHAETLAPSIEFLCASAGVGLDELGAVAVDVGPGLFTGLRVGMASAKAIAYARRLPMVGVSSLDLVAFGVRHTARTIVCVLDARRGEVFWCCFKASPGGVQRLGEPQVGTVEELASDLLARGGDLLAVGDGALRYRAALDGVSGLEVGDAGRAHPSAAALVQLAHARALREEFVAPHDVAPLYLRLPDAEINWQVRDGVAR